MLHELPVISIPIKDKIYNLLVASTEEEKNKGLSGVQHLEDNEGMLFVYDDDKPRQFQFKDTCLPLEVYFIRNDGKVIQNSTSSPYQSDPISCDLPCRWVIEVLSKD